VSNFSAKYKYHGKKTSYKFWWYDDEDVCFVLDLAK